MKVFNALDKVFVNRKPAIIISSELEYFGMYWVWLEKEKSFRPICVDDDHVVARL